MFNLVSSLSGFIIIILLYPTLRTCFDTFLYFYDKPASRKDSHRIGEIWSCELRFYFPLVFFPVHLKLLTQCRDHAGLRNKYRKSEIRSAECRLYISGIFLAVTMIAVAVAWGIIPFLIYIFPLENFQFLLNFFQFYKSFRFYKL